MSRKPQRQHDQAPTVTETDDSSVRAAWDVPKVRDCLRCNARFASAWSGERICKHCKQSTTWKSGVPQSAGRGSRKC